MRGHVGDECDVECMTVSSVWLCGGVMASVGASLSLIFNCGSVGPSWSWFSCWNFLYSSEMISVERSDCARHSSV